MGRLTAATGSTGPRHAPVEPEPDSKMWGPPRTASRAVGVWAVAALFGVIFIAYFLPYGTRHLTLPVGFDPLWYLLHGRSIATEGIGHGAAAFKLGYPVLSVVMGTVTGRSQLQTMTILPLVLVGILALAVGGFARIALDLDRTSWAVVVLATAAVLPGTDLVGENLGALLVATFSVAALLVLARSRSSGSRWPAVALLVAAGLSHWDFLAVTMGVMGLAVAFSFTSPLTAWRRGSPVLRTEAGALLAVLVLASVITLVLVHWVLRAPFLTMELAQSSSAWLQKLLGKVALFIPALAAAFVVPIVKACRADGNGMPSRHLAAAGRSLRAWASVMAVGVVVGLFSLRLPPSRFLDLIVAFPGGIAAGAALSFLGREVRVRAAPRVSRRSARALAAVAVAAALVLVAAPGMVRWFRYGTWLSPGGMTQARTADGYMQSLTPGTPVVFVLAYTPGFAQAVAAQERQIRLGLSPSNEPHSFYFVGDVADLLAGRRTPPPDAWSDDITREYWTSLRPILATDPPILVLHDLAPVQFRQAEAMKSREIGPGVALVRGPSPRLSLAPAAPVDAVPPIPIAVGWAFITLGLLLIAGLGWSTFLGPRVPREASLGLAPALGAAAIILSGFALDQLRFRLGGGGGPAAFVVAAGSGALVWAWHAKWRGRRHLRTKITPSSLL